MDRRNFIGKASGLTILSLLEYHDSFSFFANPKAIGENLIQEIQLQTNTSLSTLKEFYNRKLGFEIKSDLQESLVVQAGLTTISFFRSANVNKVPFYHFAFNIPENKIRQARDWQLKRTELLPTPTNMIDEGYSNDIRHFRNWNAHSVFFWDPAGNLLEYIARHDLHNESKGDFSTKDILYASEIAFIVDDVDLFSNELKNSFELSEYKQGNAEFRAIGDEYGLLLVMKKGRVWMGNTNTPKTPDIYQTLTIIKSKKNSDWRAKEYPYQIVAAVT